MAKVTSEAIKVLLSQRHPPREWAFYTELPNGTGAKMSRRIDALAVCCWSKPGVGWTVAYEIKVSRSDYMNELSDPSKRRSAFENSNEFYFVAPSGVILPESLPTATGLIEVVGEQLKNGLSLKVVRPAVQRDSVMFSPEFFAALMRGSDGRQFVKVDEIKAWRYAGQDYTREEFEALIIKEVKAKLDIEVRVALGMHERNRRDETNRTLLSFFTKLMDLVDGRTVGFYNVSGMLTETCVDALMAVERRLDNPAEIKKERLWLAHSLASSMMKFLEHGSPEFKAADGLRNTLNEQSMEQRKGYLNRRNELIAQIKNECVPEHKANMLVSVADG